MPLNEGSSPLSPIAFALDFATLDEARIAAREVAPAVGMLKIGLELFVREGRAAVELGREVGLPIFLDLKLHDIPETVERAVANASALGARVLTVHASGGRTMLRRAVARAAQEGGTLAICAVTVLTSLDDGDLVDLGFEARLDAPGDGGRSRASVVAERFARLAWDEGVRWFVCSPEEVRHLRRALGPDAVLVTPGIRPAGASTSDDQKRTATPEAAIANGASWLVVGRPIRDADSRVRAAQAIADRVRHATSRGTT